MDDELKDSAVPGAINGAAKRGSLASKSTLDKSVSIEEQVPEQDADGPVKRTGSMRKRLSQLKMGMGMKGPRRGGVMKSVDEE